MKKGQYTSRFYSSGQRDTTVKKEKIPLKTGGVIILYSPPPLRGAATQRGSWPPHS